MNFKVYPANNGTKFFPLHKHDQYEIIFYTSGSGVLRTAEKNIPFSKGSIMIIPPRTEHGSKSDREFKNISVFGDFHNYFNLQSPVVITDNDKGEGAMLVTMIYNNSYRSNDYISSLCSAYIHFLLQNLKIEDNMSIAINKIIYEITDRFFDCNLDLCELLRESGYAEDYIRARFKSVTGKTPTEYLTHTRINHACFLMEIYGSTVSMGQIAEQCGYTDYAYFSKKFKAIKGFSPKEYTKKNHNCS